MVVVNDVGEYQPAAEFPSGVLGDLLPIPVPPPNPAPGTLPGVNPTGNTDDLSIIKTFVLQDHAMLMKIAAKMGIS